VGYSLGARLALGLLVRHPDLFTSATLIGVNPGLVDPDARAARAARDEEWARLLETEGLDSFVAAWEALPLFSTQGRLPERVLKRQRRIREGHDPAGLARSLRVVGLGAMPDYGPELDRLELPIRLVVGERDTKFRALAGAMAERLPRSRTIVVPDAGHNVVLEDPIATAALLREDTA
jgi:2-succinyl-6-hydroxy-2,4-cyclohexadiene-1-carboxylate synthase